MSENKFTPGPWYYSRWDEHGRTSFYVAQQDGAPYTPSYSDVGRLICETVDGERVAIQEANAMLIAVAPELLEALEEAMSMLGSRLIKDTFGYDWHEKASAAIAKARGQQ